MRRLFCTALTLALLLSLTACGEKPESAEFYAMDTVMSLTVYGKGAKGAAAEAQAEVYRLEAMLSRTRTDSAVSELNRSAGPVSVGMETWSLLDAATTYSRATGGAFDITVAPVADAWGFTKEEKRVPPQSELNGLLPFVGSEHIRLGEESEAALDAGTQVDLGGIAKGYASDCVEAAFRKYGVTSGMASLGGNVYVQATKPDGSDWRVGVRDPQRTEAYAAVLNLADAYAVTSGGYQRYFEQDGETYHHILNPATGRPADSGLLSVTIVAPANGETEDGYPGHGAMCDAFSTALFVMGEEAAGTFWREGGYVFEMVLVTDDGRVLVSEGLADRLEEVADSGYDYQIIQRAAS